jgi:hypothetical protein
LLANGAGAGDFVAMKTLLGLVVFGAVATIGLAQDSLVRRLTPEEYARAGLGKLSPGELSELEGLIKKYGGPGAELPTAAAVPPTQPKPAPTVQTATAAPKPVAPANVVTSATPKEEPQDKPGGFFRKVRSKAVAPARPKTEVETIETEVDGSFTGWEETTVWTMKDGSMWRVDNRPRPYVTARVANPRVKIYPALINGYWVEFVDLKTRVRAVRLQ